MWEFLHEVDKCHNVWKFLKVFKVLMVINSPIVKGGNEVWGNEVPVVPPIMANGETREVLLTLVWAMTTQLNRDIRHKVNAMDNTMTSRSRDFVKLNPPIFFSSKAWEDLQAFLDEV